MIDRTYSTVRSLEILTIIVFLQELFSQNDVLLPKGAAKLLCLAEIVRSHCCTSQFPVQSSLLIRFTCNYVKLKLVH